jgi:hypothetical protein
MPLKDAIEVVLRYFREEFAYDGLEAARHLAGDRVIADTIGVLLAMVRRGANPEEIAALRLRRATTDPTDLFFALVFLTLASVQPGTADRELTLLLEVEDQGTKRSKQFKVRNGEYLRPTPPLTAALC